jgi:hypothetical protein
LNSIEGTLRQARRALTQGATAPGPSSPPSDRGVVLFSLGAHNAPVSENPLAQSQNDTPYRSFEDLASGLTTGRTPTGQLLESASLQPVFAVSARVPTMPWKAAPETGHIKGVVTDPGGAVDGAEITIESANGSARLSAARTDGGGFYGHTGLDPGDYRVLVTPLQDGQYRSTCTVTVVAGAVSTLDLRIDSGTPFTAACQ